MATFEVDTVKPTYVAGYIEATSKAEAFFGERRFTLMGSSTRPRSMSPCAECRRTASDVRTTWIFETLEVMSGAASTDKLPTGLEAAIDAAYADGSIFSESSRDPVQVPHESEHAVTASGDMAIVIGPRVTVGLFRHPWVKGDDIDQGCGHRWHRHGWIDSHALSEIGIDASHGLTVCPTGVGAPNEF